MTRVAPFPQAAHPARWANALRRLGQPGFTMVELMVVMLLLAILAALAVPSFKPLIESWRVRQVADSLLSTIYLARSEAYKHGGRIVVQKLPNRAGCNLASGNAQWGCGWQVFIDDNDNRVRDSGERILRTVTTPGATQVLVSGSVNGALSFDRWGQVGGLGVLGISVFPGSATANSAATRRICVSAGGRIRVVQGNTC
ncbi:prepilin-type N-terminal cleavage/methylation domain-containing protein [Vandammella animalimorsus]|uniref:Type II secretion system protein H n=1 Tax=Vandammella animalimorsus TaxID=2029117 RepID=A0A3M6RLP3_9BURK|nr:GspH/FimT family pseudopilin [Vandammella animalimorsus]RMX15894.1 prepilin-type N-terminal cleavage/methylation domain-containing protein [Vandammella animalimorsus]